ncbi:MAG: hypothetical protein RLZZ28_258, partial [Bacteroidota bacterium]
MRNFLPCFFFFLWTADTNAQSPATPIAYSVAGSQYQQNFDGLPLSGTFSVLGKGPFNFSAPPINAAGLAGWQYLQIAGSNANASFLTGTGSSTGNGIYDVGLSASADRALGTLASGSGIAAFGMLMTNQTGILLNKITISFTAEQWRKGGSGNKNTWTFRYATGLLNHLDQQNLLTEPGLNFSSIQYTTGAGSLNGNLTENQQTITVSIRNIIWKPGEQILLRWDDADEAGSDDLVAIDNFLFAASLESSPPTILNNKMTAIGASSAIISATINDNFATTTGWCKIDTAAGFSFPFSIPLKPDTIMAGEGNKILQASITGLKPATNYFYRVYAWNTNGTSVSETDSFKTAVSPPLLITLAPSKISNSSALLGGNIISTGGGIITERGIVWSVWNSPVITKILMPGNDTGSFSRSVNLLPEGAVLMVKAFATNESVTVYGDSVKLVTPTHITSFKKIGDIKTNKDTISYLLTTAQPIDGMSENNFSIAGKKISNQKITQLIHSNNSYTILVFSGIGSGEMQLIFHNDHSLSIPVTNLPDTSTDITIIDKSPPLIKSVSIPNRSMKTGDTVPVRLITEADPDTFLLFNGHIGNY